MISAISVKDRVKMEFPVLLDMEVPEIRAWSFYYIMIRQRQIEL